MRTGISEEQKARIAYLQAKITSTRQLIAKLYVQEGVVAMLRNDLEDYKQMLDAAVERTLPKADDDELPPAAPVSEPLNWLTPVVVEPRVSDRWLGPLEASKVIAANDQVKGGARV